MWRVLVAMVGSLFPRRWRAAMPGADAIPWELGGAISGILESLAGLGALVFWYSLSVTTWAANGLDSALRGGPEKNVPGQAIGFAALLLWVLHPLTWVIGYFVVEGAVRMLGAAFTGHTMGTLPLFLADWTYGKLTRRPPEPDELYSPGTGYGASFLAAMKDKWQVRRLPRVDDQVEHTRKGDEHYLEILACRPKADWVPPRIVRAGDVYYRLEETRRAGAPRPFVYRLRKLPAGVPGRNVIVYPEAPASKSTG